MDIFFVADLCYQDHNDIQLYDSKKVDSLCDYGRYSGRECPHTKRIGACATV
jgi:hypothetical protein